MNRPLHDFLVTQEGTIDSRAKLIPDIRDGIANLPETAATFNPSRLGVDSIDNIPSNILEFLGAWPVSDVYERAKSGLYVNPGYVHSHKYPDIVVTCECGAILSRGYDDDVASIDGDHEHADSCKPFYRLRARAELQEQRYELIQRLTRMGWHSTDICTRINVARSRIGAVARDMGISFRDRRDVYRRIAGNTYAYLLDNGVSASEVEEVYGHDMSTLGRWKRKHADISPKAAGTA